MSVRDTNESSEYNQEVDGYVTLEWMYANYLCTFVCFLLVSQPILNENRCCLFFELCIK